MKLSIPNPQEITVFNGQSVFDLHNFFLGDIFQEHNPSIKRDLPVLQKISSFSQASISSATIGKKINNVVAVFINLSKEMSKRSCLKCIRMELKMGIDST
jgi:hypothetical protein